MVPAKAGGSRLMKPQKDTKSTKVLFERIVGSLIFCAFCAFLWPISAQTKGDPNKFAVIVNGAGGEAVYAKQFEEWTGQLSSVLSSRFGFDTKQLTVLKGATAEDVKRTFTTLKTQLDADNVLFVFMIGHGSFDGKQSKFNLVGPDLTAADIVKLSAALPPKQFVGMDTSSASGEFIKPLSGSGHIIITATKNGQEQNATRFAENFIAALGNPEADTDQNGRVSVLEAFTFATKATAKWYEDQGRL